MQDQELATAAEVIDALGGTNAVATMFSVGASAVSNWRVDDSFPARTFVPMNERLAQQGQRARRSLWRMASAPHAPSPVAELS